MKQFKLSIAFLSQYKNKTGKTVFRYKISGPQESIDAYLDAQQDGLIIRDDNDDLIYLTTRFAGKKNQLVVTENGKIYVDNSELEQQASIVAQLGGNLGQAMAEELAKKLVSNQAIPTPKATVVEAEETAEDEQPPVVAKGGRRGARNAS